MELEMVKTLLVKKFEEIRKRIVIVLDQLSDEHINWRPNESSNSIANLIVHINGNIKDRIGDGINHKKYIRNRDEEFAGQYKSRTELKEILNESFEELIHTTRRISDEALMKTQLVRNKERTNLEILLQCSAHFSEHMGQIFYIAKMKLDDDYISTSIPKKSK